MNVFPGKHRTSQGFTLIELLVVLVIVVSVVKGVGMAVVNRGSDSLDREAQRLAAVLEVARAQAQVSGTEIRVDISTDGFSVTRESVHEAVPSTQSTPWLSQGTIGKVSGKLGATSIQLGPEPFIDAQEIVLTNINVPSESVKLMTDGVGPFVIIGKS